MPDQLRGHVITEWVRDLTKRGVMVLLASKQGPSERLSQSGAFAQAVLDSGDGRWSRPPKARKPRRRHVADSG